MNNSTDLLAAIRGLPRTSVAVAHEPETPRYSRARLKLRYLIERGEALGKAGDPSRPREVEIAVWAPSPEGRNAGYYGCFRAFLGGDGEVLSAVLFCFYDGTEKSPRIGSLAAARRYASQEGFTEGNNNG